MFLFNLFRKRIKSYAVPLEYHDMRENFWKEFISNCEKYDYIKIKSGVAIGYKNGEEDNHTIKMGAGILIPFEYGRIKMEI